MGDSTHAACATCKTAYYLGYGTYRTASQREERFPAKAHEGHDYFIYCGDSVYGVEDGNLYQMGSYGTKGFLIVEGFDKFKKTDLSTEEVTMAKLDMKRTLDFNDLLDPNKSDPFTLIPGIVWAALNDEAQTLLDTQEAYLSAMEDAQRKSNLGNRGVKFPENVGVPQYMIDHWKSIRKGVVPFGLKLEQPESALAGPEPETESPPDEELDSSNETLADA